MYRKGYRYKLPVIVLGIELLLVALLFIPIIIGAKNGLGITEEVMKGSNPGDSVSGWLIIPALMGDMLNGVAFIAGIAVAVFVLFLISVVIGWNMLFHKLNHDNKTWMFLLAETPAGLAGIFCIVVIVAGIMDTNVWGLFVYALPGLLLLLMVMIQIISFQKERKKIKS